MISYYNRQLARYEIYHNDIMIDVAYTESSMIPLITLYEKLIINGRRTSISKLQDTGRSHIHYIRMLANEIYIEKNFEMGRGQESVRWDDCLKIALLLHQSKLKNYATSIYRVT